MDLQIWFTSKYVNFENLSLLQNVFATFTETEKFELLLEHARLP